MPAFNVGAWGGKYENDLDALTAFQDVLLRAAEGARHAELDAEYRKLRTDLLRNEEYADLVPRPIRQNRDLVAFWSEFKSFNPQWEPRRQWIREQFGPLFDRAEVLDQVSSAPLSASSQAWTGVKSRSERLIAVQTLFPLAKAAIESLIDELSKPSGNGGPILDEKQEAIDQLRLLHTALGCVDTYRSHRMVAAMEMMAR